MAWFVDGRGRRGHVSTREHRAPRNLDPLRFYPGELGHDARYRTLVASRENAETELRLERSGLAYPRYPDEAKRWAQAAVDAAKLSGDERPDIVILAETLARSKPKQWALIPSAPMPGDRMPYASGWTQTE